MSSNSFLVITFCIILVVTPEGMVRLCDRLFSVSLGGARVDEERASHYTQYHPTSHTMITKYQIYEANIHITVPLLTKIAVYFYH